MINQSNIVAFIQHLYTLKNNTAAPTDLLQKWGALSNEEIPVQLQNLFAHWQFSTQQQSSITDAFLKQQQSNNKPAINSAIKKNVLRVVGLAVLVPLIYIVYQYYVFANLTPMYAITNNVVIRNDTNAVVARLDLQVPTKTDVPSFASVQALDNTVYDRIIDSTGKAKPFLKVLIGKKDFTAFLWKKNIGIGYINRNYVTADAQEFEQYQTVFGQLNPAEANALDLKFRKIIIGSLGFDNNLKSKYSNIIKQEIIPNNRYAIIARLSDGFYYRFYGDLVENSFAKPKRIGYVENPTIDSDFLSGDLLFSYLPNKKKFCIYDCSGKNLNYYSIHDNQNRVMYFEQQLPEPIPDSNFLLDIIDTIKSNIPQLNLNL
jgi:hypothetical protein